MDISKIFIHTDGKFGTLTKRHLVWHSTQAAWINFFFFNRIYYFTLIGLIYHAFRYFLVHFF